MRLLSFCIVVLIIGSRAQAQDYPINNSSAVPKSLILYDPLFWKDELKLSSIQQKLIDKINIEFYENIKTAYSHYHGKHASHQIEIADLLMSRSEQIWEIFRHRQKRKWEKLDTLTMHLEGSDRTQSAF
jgi:hypothetical protein